MSMLHICIFRLIFFSSSQMIFFSFKLNFKERNITYLSNRNKQRPNDRIEESVR